LDRIDGVTFGLCRGFEGFDLGRIDFGDFSLGRSFGGFGLCMCHSLVGYMEDYQKMLLCSYLKVVVLWRTYLGLQNFFVNLLVIQVVVNVDPLNVCCWENILYTI